MMRIPAKYITISTGIALSTLCYLANTWLMEVQLLWLCMCGWGIIISTCIHVEQVEFDLKNNANINEGLTCYISHEVGNITYGLKFVLDDLKNNYQTHSTSCDIRTDAKHFVTMMDSAKFNITCIQNICDITVVMLKRDVSSKSIINITPKTLVCNMVTHATAWNIHNKRKILCTPHFSKGVHMKNHIIELDKGVFQSLINGLVNALSYADRQVIIDTELSIGYRNKIHICIKICDDGKGFPVFPNGDIKSTLFDMGIQDTNQQARKHSTGGTGYGLYVTKQLIQSIGGTVTLSNDSQTDGATMCIELSTTHTERGEGDIAKGYQSIYDEFGNWYAFDSHSADLCVVDDDDFAGDCFIKLVKERVKADGTLTYKRFLSGEDIIESVASGNTYGIIIMVRLTYPLPPPK
jgi:hypothetical protein